MNIYTQYPLIDKLLSIFYNHNYMYGKDFPNIRISLRKNIAKQRSNAKDNLNPEEEYIDIDKYLGLYKPKENEIVLYLTSIEKVSIEQKIDFKSLQTIVLIHEFSHWITHRLLDTTGNTWSLKLYNQACEDVHEGFAQLLTYWVVKKDHKLTKAMIDLEQHQRSVYSVYNLFAKMNKEIIIRSLTYLRNVNNAKWSCLENYWQKCFNDNPSYANCGEKVVKKYFTKFDYDFDSLLCEYGIFEVND